MANAASPKKGSPLARFLRKLFASNSSSTQRRIDNKPANMPPATSAPVKKTPPADGTFLGAIDQGTTSSRFIVFDTKGTIVAVHQMEFDQIHPHAGWTEHDPKQILSTVLECVEKTVEQMKADGLDPAMIKAIGITNQRETTVAWDAETGEPLHHALVWHDTRTQAIVDRLIAKTPSKTKEHFQPSTGVQISTYFSAAKMRWLLENSDAVKEANAKGTLRFGTIDSWLIYNLTGGKEGGVHVTDFTNASRTNLLDLKTRAWAPELLEFYEIDAKTLPQVLPSSHVYGKVTTGPLAGIPVSGCLGDQQAALVGQMCFKVGEAKNTYGTGCFLHACLPPTCAMTARGVIVGLALVLGPPPTFAAPSSSASGSRPLDLLNAMNSDSGAPLTVLKVDGGMTNSDLAMQLQADLAGIPVRRPAMRETTALGAAIAAGLATEAITVAQLEAVNADGADVFESKESQGSRDRRYRKWKKAVQRTLEWIDEDDAAAADDEVIVEA
ncbi:glycerol kinase [Allomyces macrogynus ATCC 38327]|uniref:Probable glycerol kinase n=1 Tax=Allomyces macrogynus (strain ATCC 38327) TaxID=578462 RepID=A0A0L0T4B8_ALLM3|nr:glycerol kinase [Allomyces macrogynus ATCC 38327]|eukprot:KNE69577.1 glycerol kinase [Allomyces macrogynus ATCC 38327]